MIGENKAVGEIKVIYCGKHLNGTLQHMHI